MRFAIDVGGTFSDLVVEDGDAFFGFKSATTPADPVAGVMAALDLAAEHFGRSRRALLERGTIFVHATTRALNAILTGSAARTAFITTAGHPDILLFREGGRADLFDYTKPFPAPYVPRALTFEAPERIWSDGRIIKPLDEPAFDAVLDNLGHPRPGMMARYLHTISSMTVPQAFAQHKRSSAKTGPWQTPDGESDLAPKIARMRAR
jgi:N-methylhydantoinase A